MRSSAHLKVAVVLAVVVVGLGLILLALPRLLDAGSLRNRIALLLAEWSGGRVTVEGPARLTYFPFIVLEARDVSLSAARKLPMISEVRARRMRVEFAPWSLVAGKVIITRIALDGARVRLADLSAPAVRRLSSEPGRMVEILRSLPTARLSLAGASLSSGAGGVQLASDLDADFFISSEGALDGTGTLVWQRQPVRFALDAKAPVVQGSTARAPLRLSVSSPLATAALSGEAVVADGLQLHGALDLEVTQLRDFAAWSGLPATRGRGLERLTAKGNFTWSRDRIALEDGTLVLDGNQARGALALALDGPRPAITGTLDLQQLALTQYFAPEGQTSEAAVAFDPGLLRLVDLDLRLSASRVEARPLQLGATAVSLRLNDGALAADFSALSLCQGQADGRVELHARGEVPRLRVAAKANGVATKACVELFTPASPIEGTASAVFDLSGEGETLRALVAGLDGKLSLALRGGQADIDFVKLLMQLKHGAVRGWSAVRGNPTRFDTLEANCGLVSGLAICDAVKLENGIAEITAEGSVALATGEVDGRLRVTNRPTGRLPLLESVMSNYLDDILVEGSWLDPAFRAARARSGWLLQRRYLR